MAQHIETRHAGATKAMQKIAQSIEREVASRWGLSYTSAKWQSLATVFPRDPEYKNVWQTTRYIGKGIVHGDTRGTFEVHVQGKRAVHIYLVA